MNFFQRVFGNSGASANEDRWKSIGNPAFDLGLKFIKEFIDKGGTRYNSKHKLTDNAAWAEIKKQSNDLKAEICVYATSGALARHASRNVKSGNWDLEASELKLASTLMRSKLPFNQSQLADMLIGCSKRRSFEWNNPIRSVLSAVERVLDLSAPEKVLEQALRKTRSKIQAQFAHTDTEQLRTLKSRIETILNPDSRQGSFAFPTGLWGIRTRKHIAEMSDAEQKAWYALLPYAMSATGSKPSGKWLKDAQPLMEAIGNDKFKSCFIDWVSDLKPDPERPDASLAVLKGLIWQTINIADDDIAQAIGNLAQSCFVKVPGIGARSKKLGNACIVSLSNMVETDRAAAELIRLQDKVKYPSVRSDLEKKIKFFADKRGVDISALLDRTLPDFGLETSGEIRQTLGAYTALISIQDYRANLSFISDSGKALKSVPKAVRDDFAEELKALRASTKDITAAINSQTTLLELGYVQNQSWALADWKTHYLNHPLRQLWTKALIWVAETKSQPTEFIVTQNGFEDLSGKKFSPAKSARIKLWHPLMSDSESIRAWRQKIESLKLIQPFKQAHREVYVLTDAERDTGIYSNRFAGHILRQHQFKALCDARNWRYTLQGNWDSHNVPTKHLKHHQIIAEYAVDIVSEDDISDAWVPLYLSSDQVRFFDEDRNQLNLSDIAPIIFSEVMRDVDLFVAVTSVASDPNWTDGGPEGRWGRYWQSYAFGELGETAKTRKALIADIVPKLAISDKLAIGDKSLIVTGKRHDYHIHFGSGNIMIMPENRYLCIVKAPSGNGKEKVYLPFAGDTLLSIILSKAFMLVNDDKIKDPTILSQLKSE